jgi:hypothetical protein
MEKEFKIFEELVALAPQHVKDELERLKTYEEESKWHPEANVFEHIKIVVNRLITTGDIDLIMAGLYHDIGKLLAAEKTLEKEGKFRAFGHEHIGAKWVIKDAEFIKSVGANVDNVEIIVSNHMRMKQLDDMNKSKVDAMKALTMWDKLVIFSRADSMLTEFKL